MGVVGGKKSLELRKREEGKETIRECGIECLDVGAKGRTTIESEVFPLLRWTLVPIAHSRHRPDAMRVEVVPGLLTAEIGRICTCEFIPKSEISESRQFPRKLERTPLYKI